MLKTGKEQEEMDKMNATMKELEEKLAKEEKLRKEYEDNNAKLTEEKNQLFTQLQSKLGVIDESEAGNFSTEYLYSELLCSGHLPGLISWDSNISTVGICR